jgi:DNA-directed RNA polymerase subunit RPC12/RpoP
MRKQYLHLSAYSCERCSGPVVAGSLAFRESEISKETEIKQVGAICLSCGHRQGK